VEYAQTQIHPCECALSAEGASACQCVCAERMEAEDEAANHTDVATSLSKKCDICARMGPDENKLLTEYVVKLTKDHTLSSMIQEIGSFAQNLHRRVIRESGIDESFTEQRGSVH